MKSLEILTKFNTKTLVVFFCSKFLENIAATCHSYISHNAPYLPLEILHNHCFQFLLGRL